VENRLYQGNFGKSAAIRKQTFLELRMLWIEAFGTKMGR